MSELIVDEERFLESTTGGFGEPTGIFVRAKRGERWGSYDIYVLSRESLMTWLRSRGGNNPWAESVVALLLNHHPTKVDDPQEPCNPPASSSEGP